MIRNLSNIVTLIYNHFNYIFRSIGNVLAKSDINNNSLLFIYKSQKAKNVID